MKKIVALVAALALAVPLAACGQRERNLPGSQSQQQTPSTSPSATVDPAGAQDDLTSLDALLANIDSALAEADAAPADAD